MGVTEPTYYRWRAEFGGLKLDQVKRLKELERENARLRKRRRPTSIQRGSGFPANSSPCALNRARRLRKTDGDRPL